MNIDDKIIRDMFANTILNRFLEVYDTLYHIEDESRIEEMDKISEYCYEFADRMIKIRNRKG